MKKKKSFLIITFLLLIRTVSSQSDLHSPIPFIGTWQWGTNYTTVLNKIQEKGYDYTEYDELESDIICGNYHAFLSSIGLGDGYLTIFRFNKTKQLFGIVVLLQEEKFNELRRSGIVRNIQDFLELTSIEWEFFREMYGNETYKNIPNSEKNFEQLIIWKFNNGKIEILRKWVGSKYHCKNFTYYISAYCETFE